MELCERLRKTTYFIYDEIAQCYRTTRINTLLISPRVNLGDQYSDIYQEIADGIDELSELEDNDRRKIKKLALVPWTYGGDAWSACQNYHQSEMEFLAEMTSSQRLRFAHRMIQEIRQALPTAVAYIDEMKLQTDLRYCKYNPPRCYLGITVWLYCALL